MLLLVDDWSLLCKLTLSSILYPLQGSYHVKAAKGSSREAYATRESTAACETRTAWCHGRRGTGVSTVGSSSVFRSAWTEKVRPSKSQLVFHQTCQICSQSIGYWNCPRVQFYAETHQHTHNCITCLDISVMKLKCYLYKKNKQLLSFSYKAHKVDPAFALLK